MSDVAPDMAAPNELISERFQQHYNWAEEFILQYGSPPELRVNPQAMYIAIKSAYDDIYRYKAYHLSDPKANLSDAVQRAAYLCKWLIKFRPIEYSGSFDFDNISEFDEVSAELLNGSFALLACRTHISNELKRQFFFNEQYEDEFQYDILYRNISDDGLLHIFQMIFSAVKVGRAGVLEFYEPSPTTSVYKE